MIGKRSLTALALALALATCLFGALPALASANVLTTPTGSLLPVGQQIVLTANGTLTKTTSLGTQTCEKTSLTAEVLENALGDPFLVQGLATGNSMTGCRLNGTAVAIVTNPQVRVIKNIGAGKGTLSLSFTEEIPTESGYVACSWSMPTAGVFTFSPPTSKLTLASTKLTSPLCGEMHLSGSFSVGATPAEGGGAVLIS
jgi:hypothetical protein